MTDGDTPKEWFRHRAFPLAEVLRVTGLAGLGLPSRPPLSVGLKSRGRSGRPGWPSNQSAPEDTRSALKTSTGLAPMT